MPKKNNKYGVKKCRKNLTAGALIREFRRSMDSKRRLGRKMQQAEFAQLLGCTTQAVSNYEAGRRVPTIKFAKRLVALAQAHKFLLTLDDIYKS